MNKYDVIIIGSGVGGVGVGALLSHSGLRTLVIEKNKIIGGRCSSYVKIDKEKKKWIIDLGVHGFARTDKGPFGEILKRIQMSDAIKWYHPPLENPPLIRVQNQNLPFPVPPYLNFEDLKKLIPILGLTDQDLKDLFGIFSMVMTINDRKLEKIYNSNLTFDEWLGEKTSNDLIRGLFASICLLQTVVLPWDSGNKKGAAAAEIIKCMRYWYNDASSGYPLGGCISIPQGFINGMRKYGGEIITGQKVTKIFVDDGNAVGIEVGDETLSSDIIISNIGIKETVELVGQKFFPAEYVKYVKNLQMSEGESELNLITIKVGLDKKVTNSPSVFGGLTDPSEDFDPKQAIKDIMNDRIPKSFGLFCPIPSNCDPNLAPPGKQLLNIGTAGPTKSNHWDEWIEWYIDLLEDTFPGVKKHIMWVDVTKSEDIKAWTGRQTGDIIGVAQCVGQVGKKRPKIITPIKNLYLVGADVGAWGIGTEMAAQSALDCADIVLNKIKA